MVPLDHIDDPEDVAKVMGDLESRSHNSISNTFGKLIHCESKGFEENELDSDEISRGFPANEDQGWNNARNELSILLKKVKGLTSLRFRS